LVLLQYRLNNGSFSPCFIIRNRTQLEELTRGAVNNGTVRHTLFFFWLRDRDLFAMGEDAMEVVVEEEEEEV